MVRLQAYKYELMPDGEQERNLRRFVGSCRFVYKIKLDEANARKDFLHKTTTTISQNHALVCIESLQIRNMSSSSKVPSF